MIFDISKVPNMKLLQLTAPRLLNQDFRSFANLSKSKTSDPKFRDFRIAKLLSSQHCGLAGLGSFEISEMWKQMAVRHIRTGSNRRPAESGRNR